MISARVAESMLLLACVLSHVRPAVGQNLVYQFTMGVTSPAPVPGKPFTLTWTGGEANETVYISLNNYFPDTPNQNIIYGSNDILSHAPNNGSWTYNVPLNIEAGRHSFSIGYNPVQMSDTTDIFVIDPSQTSSVPPPAITTNPAWQTYRGCGLPPLPDYTYTGYQPPCTITTSGRVETIYPIVPASDSSVFFGSIPQASKTTTATTTPTASANSAFATGVFAQALQCANPVIPSPTSITADGATTVFTLVACNTAVPSGSVSIVDSDGVCHASGYATFSVSGTSSVCCPNGWATTPLNSELFCFTSTAERGPLEDRRGLSETSLEGSHTSIVDIVGLVFTAAGVVTKDVSVSSSPPDASPSGSAGGDSGSTATATRSSAASTATTKSGGVKLNARLKVLPLVAGIAGILPYLFL